MQKLAGGVCRNEVSKNKGGTRDADRRAKNLLSAALGINGGGLSQILNNRHEPFPFERRKLEASLPARCYQKFFPIRPKPEVELVPWEFSQHVENTFPRQWDEDQIK